MTYMFFVTKGNVVNGTIGKQMVDTLVESASNVEVWLYLSLLILHFYAFLNVVDFPALLNSLF